MDSANLRANGDDRGPSMGGMISPKAPPVDTLYYDPDIGKYVKCPTLRLSDSQHGRCNSASAMPSSQRLPNLESIMDPSVLAGRTSPQYGRHGSRYMDSSNPQMNGHNRGQSVNDMSSPQRPIPSLLQDSRPNSSLPTSATAPNLSKLGACVFCLSNPHFPQSDHSTRTLSFHSRIHGHCLRRSIHSVDLRSYATTTSTPSNKKVNRGTTDSGGSIGFPLSIAVQRNSYASGYTSSLTHSPPFYERLNEEADEVNTKKVENWILTARTGNEEWPKSPLTPRPFTSQELEGRVSYVEAARGDHLNQKDDPDEVFSSGNRKDDTPRASIRAQQPNPLQAINPIRDLANDWFPPGHEEADVGTSFAALANMHRAQEQFRLGVGLPPLSSVGAYKTDRTMRESLEAVASEGPGGSGAPILEPSPPTKTRKKGDPIKVNIHPHYTPYSVSMHLEYHNIQEGQTDIDELKKPSPLKLQPNHTEKLAVRDDSPLRSDSQTYTTKGLTQVLYKLYTPSHLPSDVLAALPSAEQLTSLSNPTSPVGALAFARTYHSPSLPTELSSKERNYVAYYIDTLLTRNTSLVQSNSQLENDVEDAEVSKAGLQEQINKWFFEARESKVRAQTLETFIEDLVVNVVPKNKKEEARSVAMGLGVEIEYTGGEDVGAGPAVEEVENKEEMVSKREVEAGQRTRRLEEEVKYWKARAEAAERFVGALG
jgi:hypothetical protein